MSHTPLNQSWQPTPGSRLSVFRPPSARRGCTPECFSAAIGPARLHSALDIMRTTFAGSRRALLYVLFWLFETLLIASAVVLALTDSRRDSSVSDAAGLTFWFAFVGLFTVSYSLRHVARRLAIIGWLSLFVTFWGVVALPSL
jgi:hypothetical protein